VNDERRRGERRRVANLSYNADIEEFRISARTADQANHDRRLLKSKKKQGVKPCFLSFA
jgi:hypothetical protein